MHLSLAMATGMCILAFLQNYHTKSVDVMTSNYIRHDDKTKLITQNSFDNVFEVSTSTATQADRKSALLTRSRSFNKMSASSEGLYCSKWPRWVTESINEIAVYRSRCEQNKQSKDRWRNHAVEFWEHWKQVHAYQQS